MPFPAFDPNYPQVGDQCTIAAVEKAHVLLVVERVRMDGGSYEDAAKVLDIQTSTLWQLRKKYGGGTAKRGMKHEY
jgi:hypothetical protein